MRSQSGVQSTGNEETTCLHQTESLQKFKGNVEKVQLNHLLNNVLIVSGVNLKGSSIPDLKRVFLSDIQEKLS